MYSRVKLLGHPVHPMLAAYPIAFYTATFAAYVIFLFAHGDYTWMKIAIVANFAGVVTAVAAAIPGLVDWTIGIPSDIPAKRHGAIHMGLNLTALLLFTTSLVLHLDRWNVTIHPHTATGIILSGLGVLCTVGAGFFGWIMVQTDHVGTNSWPDRHISPPVSAQGDGR